MFGRSGQMFPNPRRVYHDAMYEEEYGSSSQESETDCCSCCRSKGISAVFCWCLSVIILIGLAASIILTVFFIFKSRTFVGKTTESGTIITTSTGDDDESLSATTLNTIDDLDLLYGIINPGGNSNNENNNNHDDIILEEQSSSEIHDFVIPSPKTFKPLLTTTTSSTAKTSTSTTTEQSTFNTPSNNNNLHRHNYNYPSSSSISPVINYKSVIVQTQNPITTTDSTRKPSSSSTTSRKVYNELVRSSVQNYNNNGGKPSSSSTSATSVIPAPAPARKPTTFIYSSQELESEPSTTTTDRSSMIRLILDTMNSLQPGGAHLEEEDFPTIISKEIMDQWKAINKSRAINNIYDDEYAMRENHERLEKLITTILSSASIEQRKKLQDDEFVTSTPFLIQPPNRNSTKYTQTFTTSTSAHQNNPFDEYYGSTSKKSTASNEGEETTTFSPNNLRNDLLSRIIKNLAPKFKNKTENTSKERFRWPTSTTTTATTTTAKPSSNQNVIIITPTIIMPSPGSAERDKLRKANQGGLEIVKAPDFSWTPSTSSTPASSSSSADKVSTANNNGSTTTTEQQFLDILVGSQDSKTLITKETDDGIVTSVILPPWYENDTFDDYPTTTSTTTTTTASSTTTRGYGNPDLRGKNRTVIIYPSTDDEDGDDGGGEEEENNSKEEADDDDDVDGKVTTTYSPPSLGNLFRKLFFSQSFDEKEKAGGESPESGDKVAETTTTTTLKPKTSTTKKGTTLKKYDEKAEFSTTIPIHRRRMKSSTTTTTTQPSITVSPASVGFHQVSPDGKTNIYGYYPQSDEIMHFSGSKRLPATVLLEKSSQEEEGEGDMKTSPSHVIEVEYDGKTHSEIIIDNATAEDDDDNLEDAHHADGDFLYGNRNGEPVGAGSSIRPQIVRPPPSFVEPFLDAPRPTGGGIRHPMRIDESTISSSFHPNELSLKSQEKSNEKLTKSKEQTSAESDEEENQEFYQIPVPATINETANLNLELNRKPIQELDESLYPLHQIAKPSAEDSEEIENGEESEELPAATSEKNVVQVFAVKYTPSTTESSVDNTKNDKIPAAENFVQPTMENFAPPQPINFHSNTFSFSPAETSGGFLPFGGYNSQTWRPLAYDNDYKQFQSSQQQKVQTEKPEIITKVKSIPVKEAQQIFLANPRTSTQRAFTSQIDPTQNLQPLLPAPSPSRQPLLTEPQAIPFFNNYADDKLPLPPINEPNAVASNIWSQTTEPPPSLSPPPSTRLSIRPSHPIPALPTPPLTSQNIQYHNQHPQQMSYPLPEHNNNNNNVHPHPPEQLYHHPHHHQQEQQQLHHHNQHIDRTKYQHRPAPPPILMRRTPHQAGSSNNNVILPYIPDRNQLRKVIDHPPQYLSNQQQLLRQQQLLHQHMTRMKGNHNNPHQNNRGPVGPPVHWPPNSNIANGNSNNNVIVNSNINDFEHIPQQQQQQQQQQIFDNTRVNGFHNNQNRRKG